MLRVALIVLDGWGLAPPGPGNAIELADTPVFDRLWGEFPHTKLRACGRDVGLPAGQMGNSEVGHLNLGAGAVVKQDLARIDDAVADGTFYENRSLLAACELAGRCGRLHLVGLVSDGGVHSGWHHLQALIELAGRRQVPEVIVHAFTDGRDTLPRAGAGYLRQVEQWLAATDCPQARIGTVVGRYYAMDRDHRWQRTKRAYDAIVHGVGERATAAVTAVESGYGRDQTDEFVEPIVVGEEANIREGDAVIFFNFRPDRARQLTEALGVEGFDAFDRGHPPHVQLTTMTEYRSQWTFPVAFPPRLPETTLAQVIADRGWQQLHVAETEKYAHVTYFFNGGREEPHRGEERFLAPSPQDVPTYDHRPEMSARAAADAFCKMWAADEPQFRFGIINFANADMVGHTGVIEAAVKGVETVDSCLSDVVEVVGRSGGACLITADHGNADNMLEPDGSPNTAHSLNPVPLIVTAPGIELAGGGVLADIAPTVLDLLGVPKPAPMTGRSLVNRIHLPPL